MAEPDSGPKVGCGHTQPVDHGRPSIIVLDVDRQVVFGSAGFHQFRKGGDVLRQLRPAEVPNGAVAEPSPDHAVVVDDGNPVAGDPDVGLEAVGTQSEGKGERLEGVLGGVGPTTSVGKADRAVEQRGETLLHGST